jgi:L-lactate dehydrogenase complex protein LldG
VSEASARDRVLARIRSAVELRERIPLPGPQPTSHGKDAGDPIERFTRQFGAAGGEVVVHADRAAAVQWCKEWYAGFRTAATSTALDPDLVPSIERVGPEDAELAVSVGLGAAAETGTVLLDSRDGRRLQLLAPVHLVWLPTAAVYATLGEALDAVRGRHGAAIGLHSGPSKSADIGGVLVRGVHGPGRVVVALLGAG